MRNSLAKTAFSALRWNYAGFLVRSASMFIVGIVLARLLGPKPFGELAAVALVFGLANQLAETGFSSALIQARELTDLEIRFAFTVQLASGAAMTLLTLWLAPYFAAGFHDGALQRILRVVAPLFVLQSFGQTSTALLKRRLDLKSVQAAQISSYLLGYVLVGIPSACLGAGVWSLVTAQLVQSFAYSVQVYARVRHSFHPSLHRAGFGLLGFGTKVAGTNIMNWSISNLDNAVIGHGFGSNSLGLYSRAFNLASTPADGIVSACQQVLFSSCSRAAHQLAAIRRAYLASTAAVSLVLFPLYWSMAACPLTVVLALYGPRWTAVAPLFRPLALAIPLHALMALSGPLLAATNRVKVELRGQVFSLLFAALIFGLAVRHSAVAVAWAVLSVYAFRCCVVTAPTLRVLNIRWRDLFRATKGAVWLGIISSSLVFLANWLVSARGFSPLAALAVVGLAGLASVCAVFVACADLLLAPELVALLITISSMFPGFVSKMLDQVVEKQTNQLKNQKRSAGVGPISEQPAGRRSSYALPVELSSEMLHAQPGESK